MTITFLLDIVIAVLLVVTIVYCWRLSGKISLLQNSKKDLQRFIDDFSTAIGRAEKNITEIKDVSADADKKLLEHIQKARFLANDLSFLMDKGENVADTLEHFITTSRAINKTIIPSSRLAQSVNGQRPEIKNSGQERSDAPSARTTEAMMTPSKKNALDSVLAQISARRAHANNPSEAGTSNAQNKTRPADEVFDKRRLAESLKSIQRAE